MRKPGLHVVRTYGGWGVKSTGNHFADDVFDLREDAITEGRTRARHDGLTLYIYDADGRIESSEGARD